MKNGKHGSNAATKREKTGNRLTSHRRLNALKAKSNANVSSASVGIALFVICAWEGTKMVLASLLRDKWRREAQEELNAEWEAWLKRRDEAQKNGQPFDEPSPSQRAQGQAKR